MLVASKPFKYGQEHTIGDPFDMGDEMDNFESALKKFFYKEASDAIRFKMPCAKEIALVYAKSKKDKYDEIKISSQLLEISDIQDVMGKKVFKNLNKIYGWFIFIDENIFANWSHDCRYIFYVSEKNKTRDEMFFEEQMLKPPFEFYPMEVV